MPSFSTKEIHIRFFDGQPEDGAAFNAHFSRASENAIVKLTSALDYALELGQTKDVTMIATFASDKCLHEKDFNCVLSFIETHADVKRIVSVLPPDTIVMTTETEDRDTSFVVTLRFSGGNKFDDGSNDVDSSFETAGSDEKLTQQVMNIPRNKRRGSHL